MKHDTGLITTRRCITCDSGGGDTWGGGNGGRGIGVDVGVTQGGECGECGVGVDLDGEAQSVSSSSLSDKALATSIQSTPVASFFQCNTVPARPHDLYIYIYI